MAVAQIGMDLMAKVSVAFRVVGLMLILKI
jgi:hypothetical protein